MVIYYEILGSMLVAIHPASYANANVIHANANV